MLSMKLKAAFSHGPCISEASVTSFGLNFST